MEFQSFSFLLIQLNKALVNNDEHRNKAEGDSSQMYKLGHELFT